jgi:hypothetical protein
MGCGGSIALEEAAEQQERVAQANEALYAAAQRGDVGALRAALNNGASTSYSKTVRPRAPRGLRTGRQPGTPALSTAAYACRMSRRCTWLRMLDT